jgi:DNA-binding CsgD family transcriptional regulator
VLDGVAAGLTREGIAARLEISPWTVNQHMRSVLHKLSCATRAEAVAWGIRRGIIQ